ncbi:hypothetical protein [Catellatospora sp. IY07-71]|uniref:hypothetical protein n=1 Tax=Catellatospora sp. IY07-71 TaxID=2728827 RepID=UPI001BB41522|nr:hypothetical protein [Catellatospora sp. IY07-71]
MSRLADRLARALLRAAAARQPLALRADLHREWLAELHVLAAEGRIKPLLGYALSLAASRPAPGETLTEGGPALRRAVGHAVLVLLAPALCHGLLVVSFLAMGVLRDRLLPAVLGDGALVYRLQLPLVTLFALCFAVLMGWAGRRLGARGPLRGRWPVAIVLLVVVAGTAMLADALTGFNLGGAMAVWVPSLLLAVLVAGRKAGLGRPRRGWLLGAAIMVLAIEGAMLVHTLRHPSEAVTWHYEYALLWLPAVLADWSFGLPYPTAEELFWLGDVLPALPQLVLLLSAYAIGYAVGAARPAQEPSPGVSSASSSVSAAGGGTSSA